MLEDKKEIVEDGKNGFLWETLDDFQEKTIELIQDQILLEKFSVNARESVKRFCRDRFDERINDLIL